MSKLSDVKKKIYVPDKDGFLDNLLIACKDNTLPALRQKLQDAGTDFASNDFMQLANGTQPAWNTRGADGKKPIHYIDYIARILVENNDPIKLEDWKFNIVAENEPHTLISYAAKLKLLDKVFAPDIWVNRIADMEALWQCVPDEHKSQINFAELKQTAELSNAPALEITASLRKESLFTPNDKGLSPLDTIRNWQKIWQIAAALAANNEALTKADLLRQNGRGRTYLEIGFESGQQHTIVALLARRNETITPQDVKDARLERFVIENSKKFYEAVKDGETHMAETMIKAWIIDLEYRPTPIAETALCLAKVNDTLFNIILQAGANPDVTYHNTSLLGSAAYQGRENIVIQLIAALEKKFDKEPNKLHAVLTRRDADDYNPIRNAKRYGNNILHTIEQAINRAQFRMSDKTDLNITKILPGDNNLMHLAAVNGDLSFVQKVIEKYKDQPQVLCDALVQQNSTGKTPEQTARDAGNKVIEGLLQETLEQLNINRGDVKSFYQAAEAGNDTLVTRFIAAKTVPVDAPYFDQNATALMIASQQNHDKVVDILLANGADADARSLGPRSVLSNACYRSTASIVTKIITALQKKYHDKPVALFKALTFKHQDRESPYYIATKENKVIAPLIEQAVLSMFPQVPQWDNKTLIEADAYRVFGEHGKLAELFAPQRWKGKLNELEDAWRTVPVVHKKQVNYDAVAAEAYQLSYPIDAITNKSEPLLTMLASKTTWNHIDNIVIQLAKHGEKLTKADLLHKAGGGKTLLYKAIEFGQTDKIFTILTASGERLGRAELSEKPDNGPSILELLTQQKKLSALFTVGNWVGNVREMHDCWARVATPDKTQLDGKENHPSYHRIVSEVNAQSNKNLQRYAYER